MKIKLIAAMVLGVAISGQALASEAAPQVAKPYQESFNKAWKRVNEGELPVYECIHVADIAAREVQSAAGAAEARKAYRLCYVDSALRYSERFFLRNNYAESGADGKPLGCVSYERYLRGHVTALEPRLAVIGFSAAELNNEINQRLSGNAAKCGFSL